MVKTMKEIAELAGVSVKTVSLVLNRKDEGKVSEQKRRRILALIEQLNYEPNALARSLVRRETNMIMLIVPTIKDDYYPKVTDYVTAVCRKNNKRVLLGVSNLNPTIEAEYLNKVAEGLVDGLLISSLQREENIPNFMELSRRNFPIVHLDDHCRGLGMNTVKYEDYFGACEAMQYLVDKGHRRIAFCSATIHFETIQDRLKGYHTVLKEHGGAVDPSLVITSDSGLENWPHDRLTTLLSQPERPTAIFAENDIMAIACIRLIRKIGLRVPQDIAVVGFNNTYPQFLVEQPLTTVALPVEEACTTAIKMLIEIIARTKQNNKWHPPQTKILKPQLVIGDTA